MKIKLILIANFIFLPIILFSQKYNFRNLQNDFNRNIIYIGIQNKLSIIGNIDSIKEIKSKNASIFYNKDTVSITPRFPGRIEIEVITKNKKSNKILLLAKYLPSLDLKIEKDNIHTRVLNKKNIIDFNKIEIIPIDHSDISFINNLSIESCEVILNRESFLLKSNFFSTEIIELLARTKSGKLCIQKLIVKNKVSNVLIKLDNLFCYTFQ